MSHQVLCGPTSHAVAEAAGAIACVVATPPTVVAVERLHDTAWPMADAESLRGVALLEESRLSAECVDRIGRDHTRLFVGVPQRCAVAPTHAPDAAAPALARLRFEIVRAEVLLPAATGVDLSDALHALAALLTGPVSHVTLRWRHELLDEHLLTWGTRCLTRTQLGAQTFFFQGVATLGLGLLRRASEH
ncbi:hypothetical protein FHE66_13480 [Georgenia sp. 311]|uniref:Uncharacterized protein n=1 Tax=Georgenia wutianyii TaxID=2585135 RepID=A0ABX5VNX9_9MICO|nr:MULTISPECIES: hypothetical protein [Georgenia]QDB78530.1 hypothetical protein FE251_03395 [Georgenia wutianyii]TNC16822.1 hypothetical protein FHE66_13480 [Georgenia sp. 311]